MCSEQGMLSFGSATTLHRNLTLGNTVMHRPLSSRLVTNRPRVSARQSFSKLNRIFKLRSSIFSSMSRPSHSTANKNPAQILLEGKIIQRTTAEKQADEAS